MDGKMGREHTPPRRVGEEEEEGEAELLAECQVQSIRE